MNNVNTIMEMHNRAQNRFSAQINRMNNYRQEYGLTILLALSVGILSYYLYIGQALLDSHAQRFPWLLPGGLGGGRWLSEFIGYLHYDANIPVLIPLLGISLGLISAVLIISSWKPHISKFALFLSLAFIVSYPSNLGLLYYTYLPPVFYASLFLGAIAFYVTQELGVLRFISAVILIMLMLASYQVMANVIITVCICATICQLGTSNTSSDNLKNSVILLIYRGFAVIFGGLAYRLSLSLLGISPPRTVAYTSLSELPGRFWEIFSTAFEHLVVTQPEFLAPVKYSLLAMIVLAAVLSIYKARHNYLAIALLPILWVSAVFATKAIFLAVVPDGSIWDYRYNLALGYLYLFAFFYLITGIRPTFLRRCFQIFTIIILWHFICADLLRQGVLLRGQQHDLALANRILMRIETLPNIDHTKTYDLVRIGKYSFYRLSLMRLQGRDNAFERLGDSHMDIGEISDRWVDEDVFRLLGSGIDFQFQSTDPNFTQKIIEAQSYVNENGISPWPAEDSVFIRNDTIIIYMRNE